MQILKKRLDIWLPTYFLGAPARAYYRARRSRSLTHIIFLICDHFEPKHGATDVDQPFERLRTWQTEFARFQRQCQDRFGTRPVHTWFYPPHHGSEHLSSLSEMVFDGLGEVELHYHHQNDTVSTLRRDLKATITEYNKWGHLLESGEQPRPRFGFIHGDWALNNSCGGQFCGVNDELTLLQELGCWGDFTLPSGNACQTRKINSIYYASSSPKRPKAHDWGTNARVGLKNPRGLFLMQGPLGINWQAPDYPRMENASLTTPNWGRPDRIRKWLDCNVHVKGRPDWLFVKLHTHGAIERDFDALFGEKALAMHQNLNEQYNDGERFRLHYVTARQAYNIAKAAEHGKCGDPSDWIDYQIRPSPNTFYTANARHDVLCCTESRLSLGNMESDDATRVRMKMGPLREIRGQITSVDIDDSRGSARIETAVDGTEIFVIANGQIDGNSIFGGTVLSIEETSGTKALRVRLGRDVTIKYARN